MVVEISSGETFEFKVGPLVLMLTALSGTCWAFWKYGTTEAVEVFVGEA